MTLADMLPTLTPSQHRRYKWVVAYTDPTQVTAGGRPKKHHHYFNTKAEAETKLRQLRNEVAATGVAGLAWTPQAKRDAFEARTLLDAAGFATPLAEVAQQWIRTQGAGPASRELVTPWLDRCLDAKCQREGLSPTARDNIEVRVGAWLDREKIVTLGDISRSACLALVERKEVAPTTRKNDMNAVSSFLTWLVEEQVLPANPLRGMRRPHVSRGAPTLYTAAQGRALLEAAARYRGGRHARAVGLLLLAGLRPSEVAETTLDLDHAQPAARVTGGKMRGRANRIVFLRPAAAAWLKAQTAGVAPLTRKARDQVARLADVPWKQDAARHSWISAQISLSSDENLTARQAGTSPDVIFRHYHRLMTQAEAEAWTALGTEEKSA